MKTQFTFRIPVIALSLFLSMPVTVVLAQDGTLDSTFGSSGKTSTSITGSLNEVWSVAVQSDGKIVAAGWTGDGTTDQYSVVRYNSDGTLDNAFGAGGKVSTMVDTIDNEGRALLIQPDGKIVVAGTATGNTERFGILRYSNTGLLDNSFGTNGKVLTSFGAFDAVWASVLQGDGKIVVAGNAYVDTIKKIDLALARYNTDGSLDATFGSGGKVQTDFDSSWDRLFAMTLQSDGKIIVAGQYGPDASADFLVTRYNTDGTLDISFGNNGKVLTDVNGHPDYAEAIAVQNNGKIVVSGYTYVNSNYDFAIARYNSDGSLDNTFGTGGKKTIKFGTHMDWCHSLVVQNDGKIIVGGGATNSAQHWEFAIARFDSSGALDNTFGTGGKLMTSFGTDADIQCMVLQADGKLIAAGYTGAVTTNENFALVRYNVLSTGLIPSPDQDHHVSLYPNPAQTKIDLSFSQPVEDVVLNIVDLGGKLVYSRSVLESQYVSINTEDLENGFYLLHITSSGRSETHKLIITH